MKKPIFLIVIIQISTNFCLVLVWIISTLHPAIR